MPGHLGECRSAERQRDAQVEDAPATVRDLDTQGARRPVVRVRARRRRSSLGRGALVVPSVEARSSASRSGAASSAVSRPSATRRRTSASASSGIEWLAGGLVPSIERFEPPAGLGNVDLAASRGGAGSRSGVFVGARSARRAWPSRSAGRRPAHARCRRAREPSWTAWVATVSSRPSSGSAIWSATRVAGSPSGSGTVRRVLRAPSAPRSLRSRGRPGGRPTSTGTRPSVRGHRRRATAGRGRPRRPADLRVAGRPRRWSSRSGGRRQAPAGRRR